MRKIISLAELVPEQKIIQHEFIFDFENNKSKMAVLLRNVVAGNIKSDQDAYDLLYGGKEKEANLSRLKNRLYSRMLNSILFTDLNKASYSTLIQAAKSCYKNYTIIRYLLANKKRDLAIDLAINTYSVTKRFEFTDLNFLLCGVLSIHYSMFDLRRKKSTKFNELRKYYLQSMEAEIEGEQAIAELNLQLSKSSTLLNPNEIKYYKDKADFLEAKLDTIKTRTFYLYSTMFKSNLYLELGDYKAVILATNKGIAFFDQLKEEVLVAEFGLKTRLAIAKFMLKEYNEAEDIFLGLLEKATPAILNWYSTNHLLFSLNITQANYKEAYEILSLVINQKNFDQTHPLLVQLFRIKEAYIHFLVELGKINPEESKEKPLRKFRLNRFLNDVPNYSKDKRGVNISILIIQMLLLVQNKKHGEIIDKLDALNMYSHRYLRSDNTFRSNCFIKMLAKLPDADYHPIRWERYVKKFRQRLEDHPFEHSYHNLDLEVIPFETLYDLVIEMLYLQKGMVAQ